MMKHNPIWYYLLSLAFSDIFTAAVFTPILIAVLYQEEILERQTLCNISGFSSVFAFCWSLVTIAAISLYKQMNLRQYDISKRKTLYFFILYLIIVLIVSLFFSLSPIIGVNKYIHFKGRKWCYAFSVNRTILAVYTLSLLAVVFVLPIIVIIVCNLKVFLYVKKTANVHQRTISGRHQHGILHKRKIKVLKLSLIVVLIFCIMWLPMVILFLLGAFGRKSPLWYSTTCYTMVLLQGIVNPILYCLRHATFTKELNKMFTPKIL